MILLAAKRVGASFKTRRWKARAAVMASLSLPWGLAAGCLASSALPNRERRGGRLISAAAHFKLTLWCRDCRHLVEPDPAARCARSAD